MVSFSLSGLAIPSSLSVILAAGREIYKAASLKSKTLPRHAQLTEPMHQFQLLCEFSLQYKLLILI
jgi:hypothetical protein